jgi:hypothetical protein
VIAGWVLLCTAVAVALSTAMPLGAALLVVGAVNLAGGAFGIYRGAENLKTARAQMMSGTVHELESSATAFSPGALEAPYER